MKDDRLYLIHIWECIQRIESYSIEGKSAFLDIHNDARCNYPEL